MRQRERADACERERVDEDLQQALDQLGDGGERGGEAARVQRVAEAEHRGADACDDEPARVDEPGEKAEIGGDVAPRRSQPTSQIRRATTPRAH